MPPRLGALIAVVLWGISFVATKAALREIPPIVLITARFALGLILLWTLLLWRRQAQPPPRERWLPLAVMGLVGVAVHQLLQAYGLTLTSATHTGWLIALIPIWSAILAALFLHERFGPAKLAGLALGFAGAVVVVTGGSLGRDVFVLPSTRGDLLILASTLNWAIYTVLGHRTIRSLGATRATAYSMLLGWLFLLPFFFLAGGLPRGLALSPVAWGAVLFLGLGCSGLGYLLWYGALEKIEATRVASFLYLEPLVTLGAAVALLGERVTASVLIGGAMVLAGVALVQRRPGAKEVG